MRILARAYSDLSTCRGIGFGGVGPIPITAMWQWCERHSVEHDVGEFAIRVMRSVDRETMRRQAQENSSSTSSKK